jgi:hypothetical protein
MLSSTADSLVDRNPKHDINLKQICPVTQELVWLDGTVQVSRLKKH